MKRAALVFGTVLLAALPALPGGDASPVVAFRDVSLVPMTSAVVLPHQTVLVKEGRIVAVGDSRTVSVPPGATVIEGTGKYLMPGLADMHVHFGLIEWETPDANLYLANGVTTVRDLTQGGPVSSIKRWSADFNAKKRLGPTIYNAWTLWGNEAHLHDAVPLIKANGYDCLKVNDFYTRADFVRVVKDARDHGLYTLGHVPYPLSMEELIASGIRELSHVELLPIMLVDDPGFESLPKSQWGDEVFRRMSELLTPVHGDASGSELQKLKTRLGAEILKLKNSGITITTTLVCDQALDLVYNNLHGVVQRPESKYLAPRFWDDLMKGKEKNAYFRGREWAAKTFYDLVMFSAGEIRKNGIPIVAGTDSGPVFIGIVPGFSLHEELRLLVEAGYTPYEALSAATRNASEVVARMTGRDEFGTVEVGKRADLLLVAGNPLESPATAARPLGVMTAGVWLSRPELDGLLQVKRRPVLPILRETARTAPGAAAVIAQYREFTKANRLNQYWMTEADLTMAGYGFLTRGKIDDAIEIFTLNRDEYPFSANVYDCLGEAYLKKGDKSAALANYRKALTMDPSFASALKAVDELSKEVAR